MRENKKRRVLAAVASLVEPDEQMELVHEAAIGTVSMRRQLGVAVATAVVSLGTLTAITQPKTYYLILTTRRLLIVDPAALRSGVVEEGGAVALDRSSLRTTSSHGVALNPRFDIIVHGDSALRINYPLSKRAEASTLRNALGG